MSGMAASENRAAMPVAAVGFIPEPAAQLPGSGNKCVVANGQSGPSLAPVLYN